MRIALTAGGQEFDAELDAGAAAAKLAAALPLELTLERWGDGEYYGALPVPLAAGGARREVYAVGEIAYWPPGNALCIFFGPTPASHGDEPRMASPGVALGRLLSNLPALRGLGPSVRVALRVPGREA